MTIHQGSVAAKRIFKVIDKPIEIKNDESLPELNMTDCNIEFKNVDFKYEIQMKGITNINFKTRWYYGCGYAAQKALLMDLFRDPKMV